MRFHPDEKLKCLLVYPRSQGLTFWDLPKSCAMAGCKTLSPPLGLLTVAAILPQHWEFRLLDLNCEPFDEEPWDWADLVCTGGMLPQQAGIVDLIHRGARDGKFVAVGGPDPSSQPEIYERASALVLQEGEITIPLWLDSWREGKPTGVFTTDDKPDVTKSPIPRYDLVNFDDYLYPGIQISRGCPFNCEFCDVIELYGRKPRLKTPEQVVAELESLYRLGYSGQLQIVDDNFVGNPRYVKREILPAVIAWMESRQYPFYVTAQASIDVADDEELLALMRAAEFRGLFIGVETPDPELLRSTQKPQNLTGSLIDRMHKLYDYGMVVAAGFILGFDNEKDGIDLPIIRCVEDTEIAVAMVGLLIALPDTQLTRRLRKERRLIGGDGKIDSSEGRYRIDVSNTVFAGFDQMNSGLNFVTTRDRRRILREYLNVLNTIYAADSYFQRVVRAFRRIKFKSHYWPRWFEIKRLLRGSAALSARLLFNRETCWPYIRTVAQAIPLGLRGYVNTMKMLAIYVDLKDRLHEVNASIERRSRDLDNGLPASGLADPARNPE